MVHYCAQSNAAASTETIGRVTAKAAAAAVALAVGYQLPLWWCIACPTVLGLLAPLVINASAGAVANAVCDHYHLPAADCANLWCAALRLLCVAMLRHIGALPAGAPDWVPELCGWVYQCLCCANRSARAQRDLSCARQRAMRASCDVCGRWSALAVAMILSLASAIPIVYICKLPQCGKRAQP